MNLYSSSYDNFFYIESSIAYTICESFGVDLDIFFDKYSDMQISNNICDKYAYRYSEIENTVGVYDNNRKKIIIKTDIKRKVFLPTFLHELGHFVESYFFKNNKLEYLNYINATAEIFNIFEIPSKTKSHKTISEYIAHMFALVIAARIDKVSTKTNYYSLYYNHFELYPDNNQLGEFLFKSFMVVNNAETTLKNQISMLEPYDYVYLQYIYFSVCFLLSKFSISEDDKVFEKLFKKKYEELQQNKATFINDAITRIEIKQEE